MDETWISGLLFTDDTYFAVHLSSPLARLAAEH